jgi:hypothetical protein
MKLDLQVVQEAVVPETTAVALAAKAIPWALEYSDHNQHGIGD